MKLFQYKPINLDETTFRLVILRAGFGPDIEVEIFHATLDEAEVIPYEAVSYAWGSQTKPNIVDVGGARLAVTSNLWDVLCSLRLPSSDRYLWVDAICIDQYNTVERNHQVRLMGLIYNRAERVLFYLGPPTRETTGVMDALSELQKRCRSELWQPEDERWKEAWHNINPYWKETHADLWTPLHQGMKQLLSRPWFNRVWILQEVANSRSGLVYCGAKSIPARFFALGPRLIGVPVSPHHQAVLDMMPIKPRARSSWSSGQDLYLMLLRFEAAEAQDDRDKIFALLGMCAGGKGNGTLAADYRKGISEVIRETIAYICFCKTEDVPDFLCYEVQRFKRKLRDIHDILVGYFAGLSKFGNLESLLKERGQYVTISPNRIQEAARSNDFQGKELLDALLKQKTSDFDITARSLQDAAVNMAYNDDSQIFIEFRIDRLGTTITVFQKLLEGRSGSTPLWLAVFHGETTTDSGLLEEEDFKQDYKDRDLLTPLLFAAIIGQESQVRKLLDRGANIEARGRNSQTLLSLAAINGHDTTVKLLLNKGADMEATDRYKQTPLLLAVSNGHERVVKLLLDRGANIEAKDDLQQTALYLARVNGHEEIVHLLLDRGANIAAGDENNQTPLSLAVVNSREE